MDFFAIISVILHIFITSKSYNLICNTTRKEQYFFIFYTVIVEFVVEFFFYSIYLNGLGIEKFLYPFILYAYFIWFKKFDKYRGVFLSFLLSLLYHSTHTFIAVTLSSITGDELALHYESIFFLVVLLLTYFVILKTIRYFHLELTYFDKDYLYPFFKKVFFPPAANTEIALVCPIAVIRVPSIGSTAIDTNSPMPDPTFSPIYSIGA